jgi:UDP-N-acetylglucosamine 2-epimerase (non-hydrolysing)
LPLNDIAQEVPVIFPAHPRTRQRIDDLGFGHWSLGFRLLEPLGYLDFVALMKDTRLVLTDSGGIQEETTYLGVPFVKASLRLGSVQATDSLQRLRRDLRTSFHE